jgi:hypothetical protein
MFVPHRKHLWVTTTCYMDNFIFHLPRLPMFEVPWIALPLLVLILFKMDALRNAQWHHSDHEVLWLLVGVFQLSLRLEHQNWVWPVFNRDCCWVVLFGPEAATGAPVAAYCRIASTHRSHPSHRFIFWTFRRHEDNVSATRSPAFTSSFANCLYVMIL